MWYNSINHERRHTLLIPQKLLAVLVTPNDMLQYRPIPCIRIRVFRNLNTLLAEKQNTDSAGNARNLAVCERAQQRRLSSSITADQNVVLVGLQV